MFLIMGITLGIVCTYTEIKLVHGFKGLDRMYTEGITIGSGHVPGVWLNTIGSFVLSWILGLMFSADGLTVMFGAVVSTGLSQMYFSSEKYARDQGWSVAKTKASFARTTNSLGQTKSSVQHLWADFRQPVKDLLALVLVFIKILVFPLVKMRQASVWYSNRPSKVKATP